MHDLQNNIDFLLQAYEEERNALRHMIEECLKEKEYRLAHFHFKALQQVEYALRIISSIDYPLFDEIQWREDSIARARDFAASLGVHVTEEYSSRIIDREIERIKDLRQKSDVIRNNPEPRWLDQAFAELVDGKIKRFRLYLKKSADLKLEILKTKEGICIQMPDITKHINSYEISKQKVRAMIKSGFVLFENGTMLTILLDGDQGSLVKNVKDKILKITYQIFYFSEFRNDSFIEFIE